MSVDTTTSQSQKSETEAGKTKEWHFAVRKTPEEVTAFLNAAPRTGAGEGIVTFRGRTDDFDIWYLS